MTKKKLLITSLMTIGLVLSACGFEKKTKESPSSDNSEAESTETV